MENPFEVIARRLSTIEELLIDIKHRPASNATPSYSNQSPSLDFPGVMKEYYPGIPASTVRQDTAHLSRTKVGKRILFDRAEIEEHLRTKRRTSASELDERVGDQFIKQHQRRAA